MKKTENSKQFRVNRLQGLSVGFGVDPAKEEDLDVSDQDKLAFSQYHLPDLGLHNILGVVHILRNHFWGSRETPPPL